MNIIRQLLDKALGVQEHRVLMLALDASGRTTMLYKWKIGEVVTTIPTIGFNGKRLERERERESVPVLFDFEEGEESREKE